MEGYGWRGKNKTSRMGHKSEVGLQSMSGEHAGLLVARVWSKAESYE